MKPLNEVLEFIRQADDTEISEIIKAVIRHYGQVHPDWEVFFLSLPKRDPEARRITIETVFDLLDRAK